MKYKDSGVDIDRANRAKQAIGKHVRSTWSKQVLSDTGAFGGLFELSGAYRQPVLVSSIDGVGTKLLVATMAARFDTVGQDLVNHCVNDILVQGARPLFFLDYLAAGRLDAKQMEDIVRGVATACRENECALIGGETAEMPGLYQGDDFDMAGSIVGVVERDEIIDGSSISPGDLVFAFPSSGLHTNGYSLARHILFDQQPLDVHQQIDELNGTVGEELLKVHRSYWKPVSEVMRKVTIKGIAHITGGGVVENLPRILPSHCDARIEVGSWPVPAIFGFLQERGQVELNEMFRVFNMGLGMIVIVGASDRDALVAAVSGQALHLVGEVSKGSGRVFLKGLD